MYAHRPTHFNFRGFNPITTLNAESLRRTPPRTNVFCPQRPHRQAGITILSSGTGSSINAMIHMMGMFGTGPGTRQPGPLKFQASFTALPLMLTCYGLEYAHPTPPQNSYAEVLTSSISERQPYLEIGSLPK